MEKIDNHNPFRAAKISYIDNQWEDKMESVNMLYQTEAKNRKKILIKLFSEPYSTKRG